MNVSRWIVALPVRLRSIVRRARAESDVVRRAVVPSLAMEAHAAREAGVNDDDAVRQARIALGGVLQARERCRDTWPLRWVEDLLQDGDTALRGLRRTPGFTVVAITVLALGIGANTAYSASSCRPAAPLPYARWGPAGPHLERHARSGVSAERFGSPDYRIWRAANHSFEEIGASHTTAFNLTGVDQPERLAAARLTASLWRVLKPTPLVGTLFR